MATSICGVDCTKCECSATCRGCVATDGRPFGKTCLIAPYCKQGGTALLDFKEKLLAAFHRLGIPEIDEVTELYALRGAFINMEYRLPGGQTTAFWDDGRIYLGNQVAQRGSDRCYGLAADEHYLMVCTYGPNGENAELVIFQRWSM